MNGVQAPALLSQCQHWRPFPCCPCQVVRGLPGGLQRQDGRRGAEGWQASQGGPVLSQMLAQLLLTQKPRKIKPDKTGGTTTQGLGPCRLPRCVSLQGACAQHWAGCRKGAGARALPPFRAVTTTFPALVRRKTPQAGASHGRGEEVRRGQPPTSSRRSVQGPARQRDPQGQALQRRPAE